MGKTRIFILDSKCGKDGHALSIANEACRLGININTELEVRVSEEEFVSEVPRGYDAYLIHFSNVRPEDIISLRQEQPWSKIVGVSGAANTRAYGQLAGIVDHLYGVIMPSGYRELIKNPRREVKVDQIT